MPDLGTKHECSSCGTRFYDLGKDEPICPKCGLNQLAEEEPPAPPEPEEPAVEKPAQETPEADDPDDGKPEATAAKKGTADDKTKAEDADD